MTEKPTTRPVSVSGKTALVTGGTTGIGRTTAKLLAQEGARVMIFGRHQKELDDALKDIGGDAFGIVADQSEKTGILKVFEEVDRQLGSLNILVNCASVDAGTVAETEYDEIAYDLKANLVGYLACCGEAIKRMKEKGQGDIVNLGSMSAVERGAGSDIYTAAKTGIAGFSDSLRQQLKDEQIRVILVEPGLVGTDMTAKDTPNEEQPEKEEKGEMLTTDDIAECILYILTRPRRCDIIHVRIQPHKESE